MKKIFFVLAAILMAMNTWADDFNTTLQKAQQGDASAQCTLGYMYKVGNGVTQDYAQAVYWYRKAAEKGHPYAQIYLGAMYEEGKGVAQDYTQAVYWYRKSAEQGNSYAQKLLGSMYEEGKGVDQDYTQAVYWYRKAAEQGNSYAQDKLARMCQNGIGVTQDSNFGTVTIRPNVQGCKLFIDNQEFGINGEIKLDVGQHQISVRKEKYTSHEEKIVVHIGDKHIVNANLTPNFIPVTITAKEPETEIYINEEYKGVGKCVFEFDYNEHYDIEGRRKGCQTHIVERHDFNANSPKTIAIPELKRLYGTLIISFLPKDAKLKIDGITRPTKNGEFSDSRMPMGQHVIQLFHDDYHSAEETVIVERGELTAKAYELSKLPHSQNIKIGDLYFNLFDDKSAEVTSQNSSYPYWSTNITDVKVPATVKYGRVTYRVSRIGEYAFSGCKSLKYITIPNSVNHIGKQAFYDCTNLSSIQIPNGVKSIERSTFSNCKNLKTVCIPHSVTSIENSAFNGCIALTSLTVDPENTRYCDIDGVLFNKEKTILFLYPAGKTINTYTIPNGVSMVESWAFYDCQKLKSVTIPNSVTYISYGGLSGCISLISVTVDSANPKYRDIDGVLFRKDLTELIQYPVGRLATNYIIPSGVTDIGAFAFFDCSSLNSVTIPKSVKSIGKQAFSYCANLTSIQIPNGVKNIGPWAFSDCKNLRELKYYEGLDLSSADVPETTKLVVLKDESPKQPPLLTLVDGSLSYIDNSKNNRLDANENSTIKFKINNQGKGAANDCQVRVKMSGATGGINIDAVTLPSIAVGKVYDVSIPISTDINTQNGNVTFSIEVYEPNGWGIAPFDITVATKAYDPPLLQVVDYKVASNSGKIRKMEPFTLTFNLQNTKYGDAEDVKVKISLPSNVYVMDGNAELSYPLIKSGEAKPIQLVLAANNNYPTTNIPVAVTIQEKYGKFAENKQLDIALNQAASSSIKIAAIDDSQKERKEIQLALLRSDVDLNIPLSNATNPNIFAVIIANENYEQVAKVPYAINDGNIFKQYCEKTLGIPSTNIHFVSDATINNIRQQVNWLSQVSQAYNGQASIIFYYAGHGVPDEQSKTAFLLPKDGNGMDITTGYKLDDLYKKLGQLPAKSVTIFLDACFSGSKREDGMLTSARGVAIKVKNGQPVGKMVVFTAATGDETAYPNNKEGHGMFTYYLLKKLQETSGNVTYEELGDYIRQNVSRQSVVLNGKLQTPTVIPSADATDWQNWTLK